MWEFCTDDKLNLWGLVNKAIPNEFMVESRALDPDEFPPSVRRQKHTQIPLVHPLIVSVAASASVSSAVDDENTTL